MIRGPRRFTRTYKLVPYTTLVRLIGRAGTMSFILRSIATTKTGKQIIRDQPRDGDTITLGRDSGNAIHVADLAVNPQHATIASADGRHVRVTIGRAHV